ncbi:hypothetical protein TcasGA2_TC016155 [Tribolium castaneum]|uniref:Uncharacterized protein n=1 Tax=Tribolium castaneum TaxID=7070 RepID=D6WBH9_TRICA|nr:hypothetical protein TcasGA2_TC016155 [Tribolium castaneum]
MNLRALQALDEPIHQWNSILIYLIKTKLDPATRRDWEKMKSEMSHFPTINDLIKFLTEKCHLLESLSINTKRQSSHSTNTEKSKLVHVAHQHVECYFCKGSHSICRCSKFNGLSPSDRIKEASKLRLCKNYLRFNHKTHECKSSKCRICGQQHKTLLHVTIPNTEESVVKQPDLAESKQTTNLSCAYASSKHALLPTAIVDVFDKQGNKKEIRILLDSGSQSNLIRQNILNLLGINNSQSNSLGTVTVTLHSKINSYKCTIPCVVLTKITNNLGQPSLNINDFKLPDNIRLADPTFCDSDTIDALVGVEMFRSLLCIGQISLGERQPILQKTRFGWIISGPVNGQFLNKYQSCHFTKTSDFDNDIQKQLKAFWEIEEIPKTPILSNEEMECETFFKNTTFRNNHGRFVVKLPVKKNINELGESYAISHHRYVALEKRLRSNPLLHKQYSTFIQEYLDMGHMSPVTYTPDTLKKAYFIPHHTVLRPDHTTSKICVVLTPVVKLLRTQSRQVVTQVNQLLSEYCFPLRKWSSNHPELLNDVDTDKAEHYDKSRQVIIGFEDLGHLGRSLKYADHGLALMGRGIRKRWKQPIAYYFTASTISAVALKQIIVKAVEKLKSLGLIVQQQSTVSDEGATNRSAMTQLCSSVNDTPSGYHFEIDGSKINCIFDPVHLLKNTRNALIENFIEFAPGKRAHFEHILMVFESDQKKKFRSLHKLSREDFNFKNSYTKMKVSVAARQLSYSVVCELETYVSHNQLPPNACGNKCGIYPFN